MSKTLNDEFDKADEIELSVTGRVSGQEIPRPVWFVREGDILYLLPVQGSDTNWYKNVRKNPNMKISVSVIIFYLYWLDLNTDRYNICLVFC